MSDKSGIEWTEATWNPVTGCSKVSPGCAHCYAETLSLRYRWSEKPWTPANAAENVILHPERLEAPLKWKDPRMVFVNSMSDLFHELVPFEFAAQVWDVMFQAERHTFQILTKRPQRLLEFARWMDRERLRRIDYPNVWLGVSTENQRWADERIPLLLETPAAVRFVSCEPLLGPLDLTKVDYTARLKATLADFGQWMEQAGREYGPAIRSDADRMPTSGVGYLNTLSGEWFDGWDSGSDGKRLDWVIVGGESAGPQRRRLVELCDRHDCRRVEDGVYCIAMVEDSEGTIHNALPCYECQGTGQRPKPEALEWVRSLRDQCTPAGVPFFFKQWGGPHAKSGGRLLDGREWSEMPQRREREMTE